MTFATPWVAVVAAAVTVPALLFLYFLKLRRMSQRIPSTLLWQRSFEDLEVNAPFQRLKYSLLLLLQLLILALFLLALAQPRIPAEGIGAEQVILLIDHSASMQARDAPAGGGATQTRLEHAQQRAIELVERMAAGAESRVMVIAVGTTGQVVMPFTADRRAAIDAINSIEQTDEQADLQAALDLASAFSFSEDEVEIILPDVILISDGALGRIETVEPLAVRAQNFRFVQVGPPGGPQAESPANNVGIVAFSARRSRDDPTKVRAFVRLLNARAEPAVTPVTLRADGRAVGSTAMSLPAADEDGPGLATTRFEFDLPGRALLTVRHGLRDDLQVDNVAYAVIPESTPPHIVVVHGNTGPDSFLLDGIAAFNPSPLETLTVSQWQQLAENGALPPDRTPDLVIFDRVRTRLPDVPSMTIGEAPQGIERRIDDSGRGRRIATWDARHAVLQHVNLDSVVFGGVFGYELPPTGTALAHGPPPEGGPVIASVRHRGNRHVLVAFELIESNWPIQPSFLIFLQNVLDYLRQDRGGDQSITFRPGQSIAVATDPNTSTLTVRRVANPTSREVAEGTPDLGGANGERLFDVEVRSGGRRTLLPTIPRAGVYRVEGALPPFDLVAVSLLSDAESYIRTLDRMTVNAEQALATLGTETVERDIWHWFVIAALVLLSIEWFVYLRRVMG